MPAPTVLQELFRSLPDNPDVAVRRLLLLLCELLGTDVAWAEWEGTVTAVSSDGADVPDLPDAASAVAEAPLVDSVGVVRGVLRTAGGDDVLRSRDLQVMRQLGDAITEILVRRGTPDRLTIDVEWVSRPILDALHAATGLASTYLTVVDEQAGEQEIRYSLNTLEGFELPEGLHVPWDDTLCKRSIDEGRACTGDVPNTWGDSEAARALGIGSYLSVPVRLPDGRLWGTLCAADRASADGLEAHLPTFEVFSRLIAQEVVRSLELRSAHAAADLARKDAETDPLTGCSTRRVVEPWLTAQLLLCSPGETVVAVFVDLDCFKEVNDRLGHAAGDEALRRIGSQLLATARPGDLVSRIGGDEFLVAARLPQERVEQFAVRIRAAATYSLGSDEGTCSVGWATASSGPPEDLIAAADAAMYLVKRDRANRTVSTPTA